MKKTHWFTICLRLLRDSFMTSYEFLKVEYQLYQIEQPIVTVFGGTQASLQDPYAVIAYNIGAALAQHNYALLTGGGPGMMEAASCGFLQGKTEDENKPLGIGVIGIDDDFDNPCARLVKVRHLFTRKSLLIRHALGFVILPGGIGTADELFEVLNLIKHARIPKMPVILIGTHYWKPLIDWLHTALEHNFIKPDYLDFFVVTDNVDTVIALLKKNTLRSTKGTS